MSLVTVLTTRNLKTFSESGQVSSRSWNLFKKWESSCRKTSSRSRKVSPRSGSLVVGRLVLEVGRLVQEVGVEL